jgi:hypothetical protein
LAGDVGGALADDDGDLDSQSSFEEPRGTMTSSFGPDDAGRRLVEEDRLRRDRRAGFGRVIGEVQADRDEVADAADGRADPRVRRRRGSVEDRAL